MIHPESVQIDRPGWQLMENAELARQEVRILDPGAGVGILAAALVEQLAE